MTATKPATAKKTIRGEVDEDPPVRPVAAGERAPAKPRQVTRPMFVTTAAVITAAIGWRFATGHHPGHTLAGHVFWFAFWDLLLICAVLWVWTGFRHRSYRSRSRRRYDQVRVSGQGAARRGRDELARRRGGRTEVTEADAVVIEDDDENWSPRDAARSRPRPRPAARASSGLAAKAPAEFRSAYAYVTDVDGENGQEVMARVRGVAAGLRLLASAASELQAHLTTDRGYDPRAVPGLATASTDTGEAAGAWDSAVRQLAGFYEHLLDAADDGKKAPVEGAEFEE